MDGFTLLASGYGPIEGPCADDDGGLYFSDVDNGGVFYLRPDGLIDLVVPKRKGVGGICLHAEGGIVVAGRDVSRVVDGRSEVLFTRDDLPAGTNPVSGFNDLGADARGRVFVGIGRRNANGDLEGSELAMVNGAHRGDVVYGAIVLPNGVAVSPDGRWLYHADTDPKTVAVIDLADPAPVPPVVRRFSTEAAPGGPDGMACDAEGGLWIVLHEGGCIARFTPDGVLDRTVAVPAHDPLNVCFVGPDLEDVMVVTQDNAERPELGGCVFRTSVGVRGTEVPRATI